MDTRKPHTSKPLDRYLSVIDVWAMAFGCMVGWGVPWRLKQRRRSSRQTVS